MVVVAPRELLRDDRRARTATGRPQGRPGGQDEGEPSLLTMPRESRRARRLSGRVRWTRSRRQQSCRASRRRRGHGIWLQRISMWLHGWGGKRGGPPPWTIRGHRRIAVAPTRTWRRETAAWDVAVDVVAQTNVGDVAAAAAAGGRKGNRGPPLRMRPWDGHGGCRFHGRSCAGRPWARGCARGRGGRTSGGLLLRTRPRGSRQP